MRMTRLVVSIVALGFASSVFLLSPGIAQVKSPADFTLPQGKDSPGVVTFPHEKHVAAGTKCTDCHTKIFKMKKGTSGD